MTINEAASIRLGASTATAVYLGANLVWQGEVAFNPIALGGLTVWLDASQLGLADGAAVSPWPDLSGQNNHGGIVGSPAPKLRTNILNGLPVVRMVFGEGRVRGVSGIMSSGIPIPAYNFTVFIVCRMLGPNIGRVFSGLYPTTNFLVGYHTSGMDMVYDGGFIGGTAYGALPTPWRQYSYNGQHDGTTYNRAFYKDGTLVGSGATGTTGGLYGNYNLSGYEETGTAESCDCEVAELLIYNHKLADAERIQVEGYLHTKWGLS